MRTQKPSERHNRLPPREELYVGVFSFVPTASSLSSSSPIAPSALQSAPAPRAFPQTRTPSCNEHSKRNEKSLGPIAATLGRLTTKEDGVLVETKKKKDKTDVTYPLDDRSDQLESVASPNRILGYLFLSFSPSLLSEGRSKQTEERREARRQNKERPPFARFIDIRSYRSHDSAGHRTNPVSGGACKDSAESQHKPTREANR